ncbi:MAG: AlpA family phage regulatory protein [Alcanivorax sp.]|jgi:prophage regulatory protein|nr:AlpA family phage regulatory protein [Alcanivorax sp.]
MATHLPETGYLRLPHILGQEPVTRQQALQNQKAGSGPKRPRPGIPALIPVSRSTWWNGVKSGRFPPGVKLSGGITVWRVEDIREFLEKSGEVSA